MPTPNRRQILVALGSAPPALALPPIITPAQARPLPPAGRGAPSGYDGAAEHVRAFYRTNRYEPSRT